MTRFVTLAAIAAGGLVLSACLSGCSTIGGSGAPVAEQALQNLEHCERTYQATIGALGAPGGSLFIRCPARPFDATGPAAPDPR